MQHPDQQVERDFEEAFGEEAAPRGQTSALARGGSESEDGERSGSDRPVNVHEVERIASMILGAGLSLYAIKRLPLVGIAAALSGGALLYRGVTGHCHAYAKLGVNTARGTGGASLREEPAIPLE